MPQTTSVRNRKALLKPAVTWDRTNGSGVFPRYNATRPSRASTRRDWANLDRFFDMSDSEEIEYAGPEVSTKPGKRKPASTARSNVAGPSKKAASGAKRPAQKKKKTEQTEDEDSEIEEIMVEGVMESDEDEVRVVEQVRRNSKKPPSNASIKPANATASGAAKGKGKGAQTTAKKKAEANNRKAIERGAVLSVDEDGDGDDMDVDAARDLAEAYNRVGEMNTEKGRKQGGNQQSKSAQDTKLIKENARLKEEVQRYKAHIEDLKGKFEELTKIRVTEAEALMEDSAKQYKSQIETQNMVIEELRLNLAKKEPLLRSLSGNSRVINILTREEADEEMKGYKNQLTNMRREVLESKRAIEIKDSRISELEQQNKEMRIELDAEIARSKTLVERASRNPPGSVQRQAPVSFTENDPKSTHVIKLYEDLTNVMILNVKFAKTQYGIDDRIFNCVYTHSDPLNPSEDMNSRPSLHFHLRFCHEPPTNTKWQPGMSLIENIHFNPLELDNEAPEFVERLGFLKQPFSFDRPQLALLVKTLHETLTETEEDEGEEMEEDQ